MPSVSFVVTFYNKSRYVDAVVSALRDQIGIEAPEYILVDDGSTDDTLARLEAWRARLPGVVVVATSNRGPAHATNAGLARVTRPWVKLMDGDDLLHPGASRVLVAAATGLDCGVAFGRMRPYDVTAALARGRLDDFDPIDHAPTRRITDGVRHVIDNVVFNPSMSLYSAELLERIGGCDPRVFIQDVSLPLRAGVHSPFAEVDAVVVAAPAEESTRMSANQAQTLHDLNLAYACLIRDHPELPDELRRRLLRRAAGRGWKWASRRGGRSILSLDWLFYARTRLGLVAATAESVERSCLPFRKTDSVRLPGR